MTKTIDVTRDKRKAWAISNLCGYWSRNHQLLRDLSVPTVVPSEANHTTPTTRFVLLPPWASAIGVDGQLLVPAHLIAPGDGPDWRRADWWQIIFWYLSGEAERKFEAIHGPIHSYNCRLSGWDTRLFDRAWVNRIAMFLRRWTARELDRNEVTLFGQLPAPEVILTHDVDAIHKTWPVRLKQSAFHSFNACRQLASGKPGKSLKSLSNALRFGVTRGSYWCFDEIRRLEDEFGFKSHFNVYGGAAGWLRSPKRMLFDPAYSVDNPRLQACLVDLHQHGWTIGLHQSFDAWAAPEKMMHERRRLESALQFSVTTCRQHWLRFSWEKTWAAQQQAGLELDTTLGFNDRPGFRNGAALSFCPWDGQSNGPMQIRAVPMVLMDSHLYDYRMMDQQERRGQIDHWIDEIRTVHGCASMIWHQRVMSPDYGWADGYRYLLTKLADDCIASTTAA